MKQILTLCDRDRAKDNDVSAPDDPFRFSVEGEDFELDACAPCRDEFWNLVADFVDVARRVNGRTVRPGGNTANGVHERVSCPYCGAPVSVGAGIKRHIGANHPERYAEYLAEHPNKKLRRGRAK